MEITYLFWLESFVKRTCRSYTDVLYRAKLLTDKLLGQGYATSRLKTSVQKLYDRHHDLVDRYDVTISTMRTYLFVLS